MNIHDPWAQLRVISASISEGKSATFLRVCFTVPGIKALCGDNQRLQASVYIDRIPKKGGQTVRIIQILANFQGKIQIWTHN